jgi:hypothetical protein
MNTKLDILEKIKAGEVAMKPRWHFVLKSLLLILAVAVASLLVVYLLSFILFFLRQSGVGFMPLYGFKGVSVFVMNSPWLLIVSSGALILILQLLVKKYAFSFKQPLVYSLVGIIVLVLIGAYSIEQTQLHSRLQGFSQERNTPLFSSLYRGIDEKRPENILFGTVTEVTEQGFILELDTGENLTILVTEQTKMRSDSRYSAGDTVFVFGDRADREVIEALGVRPAPENFNHVELERRGLPGITPEQERPFGPPPEIRIKK